MYFAETHVTVFFGKQLPLLMLNSLDSIQLKTQLMLWFNEILIFCLQNEMS